MEKVIKVMKRDSRIKDFDKNRIETAVSKAFEEVYNDKNMPKSKEIAKKVHETIINMNIDTIEIEQIQDLVVKQLKNIDKDVALAYTSYRQERERERVQRHYQQLQDNILNKISSLNDNANVDENSFSGREQRLLQHIEKELALENLPKHMVDLQQRCILYNHDFDKYVIGQHNCLFPRMTKLLREGFSARQGDVKPVKYFYSASQVIPVILQLQSQEQFGGVGVVDYDALMQEYVERSMASNLKTVVSILEIDIEVPKRITLTESKKIVNEETFNKAYNLLLKEMHQAVQALITNLVTLQSRAGSQVPFSSINLGLNTTDEGRLVTKVFLEELDKGIGKLDRTAIFPVTCYQIKAGINKYPKDKNHDLLLKALEVSNKRLYPTFVNCDWSENTETTTDETMNIMGCRTIVAYNVNKDNYVKEGRGNLAPVTINLPYLGLKYGKDKELFFKKLNTILGYAKETLMIRYDIMKKQPPSVAPFMYGNATIMDGEKCIGTVEPALKNCTLAIGYIGVAECVKAMTGCYHNESKEAQKLGVEIVKTIRKFCDKCKEESRLNFSVYATPAEGLCYKTAKALKKEFGVIEGITDKEYITNSHHIPVACGEDFFKKADIEGEYSALANGGNIFHIEIDGRNCNIEAMYKMLIYALDKNISYIRFSHPISTCLDCGYNLPTAMEVCEKCGSDNVEILAIVTGYLTTDFRRMNKGKQDEVRHRLLNNI